MQLLTIAVSRLCLQKRYGVEPNLMCVPPQLLLYMALAPEEKLLYSYGGPQAQAAFDAGVEGFKTRQYRGMGLVTSDPVSSHRNHSGLLASLTRVSSVCSLRSRTTRRPCRCCSVRRRSASFT